MKAERRERARRVGRLLRAARKRRGWSKDQLNLRFRELCEHFGFDPTTYDNVKGKISRWENGRRIPDQRSRRLLGLALGVPPHTLGLPLDPLDDFPA